MVEGDRHSRAAAWLEQRGISAGREPQPGLAVPGRSPPPQLRRSLLAPFTRQETAGVALILCGVDGETSTGRELRKTPDGDARLTAGGHRGHHPGGRRGALSG